MLKKLNLDDKNSLFRVIIFIFSNNLINYFILFLISILIIRNVNKDDYGLFVVVTSVFAIAELFMGGFTQAISRYLKDKIPLEDKQQIILLSLYYKYIILFIFLICVYIASHLGLFDYLISDYSKEKDNIMIFLIVAIVTTILSIFNGINNNILISLFFYRYVQNISVLKNLIYLLSVFGLIFITNKYLIFLCLNLFLNFCLLVIFSMKLRKENREYSPYILIKLRPNINIYKKYLFSYATPLTLTSLLSYARNHVPILILGKEFGLNDVAIFSILKNLFKIAHSVTSFSGPFLSKIIDIKKDAQKFIQVFNRIYYGSFILRTSIYLVLVLLIEYIFRIYNLDLNKTSKLLFYILGLEFVVVGVSDIYSSLLKTKKSTKELLYIQFARFALESTLIYVLLVKYGSLGAALILLLSRSFETLVASFYVYREKVLKFPFVHLTLLLPAIYHFTVIVLF